ncbi:MAG: hypothetical protein B7Z37_20945 [Verrucomicrobia bacterium 12-59-8]|nr:MAG: hypothetical protein B7Z37_20945 [Verrucomicrobia bacterium 12-59-8]
MTTDPEPENDMKTLRGWADKNNVIVVRHAHARAVAAESPNRSDLYRLDDYVVSSVAAGTIWLVRRNLFTEAERSIRSTMRNACVGQSVSELETMMLEREGFERDCIEEYKIELELE